MFYNFFLWDFRPTPCSDAIAVMAALFSRRLVVRKVILPRLIDQTKYAIVLENVFSSDECKAMVCESECKGYDTALLNKGGGREELETKIRKSQRCIIDKIEYADTIWARVKDFVPTCWKHRKEDWHVVGLNERLRFLRYNPGDYFIPHFDGTYERPNGDRSFLTIQLYLNQDFEGGETTFPIQPRVRLPLETEMRQPPLLHGEPLHDDQLSQSKWPRVSEAVPQEEGEPGTVARLLPKTGQVLIFQHNIFHGGSIVTMGRKYTLRTDVMYRRATASSATPERAGS